MFLLFFLFLNQIVLSIIATRDFFLLNFVRKVDWGSSTKQFSHIWLLAREDGRKKLEHYYILAKCWNLWSKSGYFKNNSPQNMRTTLDDQIFLKEKKNPCVWLAIPFFFSPSHENSPHKKTPRASDQVSSQASMWNGTEYKSTPICESKQAGQSEPAPTSAPSTGCPLWLSCGWTSTQLKILFHLGNPCVKKQYIYR